MGWLTPALTIGGGVAGGVFGGPMGAGAGMAAGGMLGGLLDGAYNTPGAVSPVQPDESLYDTSALDSISGDAKKEAALAAARAAPEADWSMADQDRGLSLAARQRQDALADELEAVLRGERTSLAQQQLRQGQIRAANEAENLAAQARGGAGAQILGQQQAQQAQVVGQLETNRLAAEVRAREEADARGQLGSLLGQMRGQDLGQRGQSQDQSKFDVSTVLQQTALNDAMKRAAWERELDAAKASGQTDQNLAAAKQGGQQAVQNLNAQREQAAQDRKADAVEGAVNAGGSMAQMGLMTNNEWGGKSDPGPKPTEQEWNDAWGQSYEAQRPPTDDEWEKAWSQSGGRRVV